MSRRKAGPLKSEKNFQDFCRLPNSLLGCFGLDFPTKPLSKCATILRKWYFYLASVSHLYVCTFLIKAALTMLTSSDYELGLFMRVISGINYSLFATLKCVTFCWNTKNYSKILGVLKEIYPKTANEKFNTKIEQYFWPKWTFCTIRYHFGVTMFIIVTPYLETVIINLVKALKGGNVHSTDFIYLKLYEVDYSFDHQSFWGYLANFIIEFTYAHFIIVFNMCGDVWLLCFTLQLCMHFDYIQETLANYQPDENNPLKDQEFIAEVVKKHQIILNTTQAINASFSLLLLFELMSIAATVCTIGIYCLSQGLSRELFEYGVFLPTLVGQYFLICYYGQLLITKSQNVAEAAYSNNWYDGSRSYKKSLLIILMRSQKAAEFNALGMQSICLEAFKMVMGGAYRIFALLRETML